LEKFHAYKIISKFLSFITKCSYDHAEKQISATSIIYDECHWVLPSSPRWILQARIKTVHQDFDDRRQKSKRQFTVKDQVGSLEMGVENMTGRWTLNPG
jgi:hypothetical protein